MVKIPNWSPIETLTKLAKSARGGSGMRMLLDGMGWEIEAVGCNRWVWWDRVG